MVKYLSWVSITLSFCLKILFSCKWGEAIVWHGFKFEDYGHFCTCAQKMQFSNEWRSKTYITFSKDFCLCKTKLEWIQPRLCENSVVKSTLPIGKNCCDGWCGSDDLTRQIYILESVWLGPMCFAPNMRPMCKKTLITCISRLTQMFVSQTFSPPKCSNLSIWAFSPSHFARDSSFFVGCCQRDARTSSF
jgi:hypothetical protein